MPQVQSCLDSDPSCTFHSSDSCSGLCSCATQVPPCPSYCFWVSVSQLLFELALNGLHVWLILDDCSQATGAVLPTQQKSRNASFYLVPGCGTLDQWLVGEETGSPALYPPRGTTRRCRSSPSSPSMETDAALWGFQPAMPEAQFTPPPCPFPPL